jgi:hypothetical protein
LCNISKEGLEPSPFKRIDSKSTMSTIPSF